MLSRGLLNTLDAEFCIRHLKLLIRITMPEYFNTDQGMQFTAEARISVLKISNIEISMEDKGHYHDDILVERLRRTVKHECSIPRHLAT